MSASEAELVAQLTTIKTAGNALYAVKDYPAAAAAYSPAMRLMPDLDEEEAGMALRQVCAVLFCNRSAARFAEKKYVASLSDAQRAEEYNADFWKVHWRAGNALLWMEPRVERSEQMIQCFTKCLASPTLPEKEKAEKEKYLDNAKHRLRTGKDKYEAAECAIS